MTNNKYVINKLGFVDFWYYDFQEFELSDGRLLLRGSNGSGKSVTMQSFIPLVLDGNKLPSRLDPSGSNDKRVENYMLDDSRHERTSYLYMEFKNNETYVTVGMGLKAEKNKSLDAWYFILNDGRRINIDLPLYEGTTDKTALSKAKLQNRILPTGFFTTKQGEYMRKVNELIFGYNDPELYEDLLNLLIQVRAPKISKDFRPATLYDILRNSLKVLSDDDLRTVSESMQNMDDLGQRRDALASSIKAATVIQARYDAYNKKILLNKAHALNDVLQRLAKIKANESKLKSQHSAMEEELTQATHQLAEKKSQLSAAEEKLKDYADSDLGRIIAEMEALKSEISRLENDELALIRDIEKQKTIISEHLQKERTVKGQAELCLSSLEGYISEGDELSQDTAFPHWSQVTVDSLKEMHRRNEISFYGEALKEYEGRLKSGATAIKERDGIAALVLELEEDISRTQDEKRQIEKNIEQMIGLLNDSRQELKIAIDNWADTNARFKISKEERLELFQKINLINESSELIQLTEQFHKYYGTLREEIIQRLFEARSKRQPLLKEISDLQAEIETLVNAPEIEPRYGQGAKNLRASLDKLKIPYTPFYQAVDFADSIDDQTKNRLESAFEQMGLLDSLVIDLKNRDRVLSLLNDENSGGKVIFCDIRELRERAGTFLKPEKITTLDLRAVMGLIDTIFSQGSASYVNRGGWYKHGIVAGKGEPDYVAAFIGENSRRIFREGKISRLKEQLSLLESESASLEQEINDAEAGLSVLKGEYEKKPSYQDIETAINEMDKLERQLVPVATALNKLEEKFHTAKGRYEKSKAEVTLACKDIPLEKAFEVYQEALTDMVRFKEVMGEIRAGVLSLANYEQTLLDTVDSLENHKEILDGFLYNKNQLEKSADNCRLRLAAKEELAREKETEDIKEEIELCTHIKQIYPAEIDEAIKAQATLAQIIKGNLERFGEIRLERETGEKEAEFKKTELLREAQYEFIQPLDSQDMEKFCRNVISTYRDEVPQPTEQYYAALSGAVYNNSVELRESNVQLSGESTGHDTEGATAGFSYRSILTCQLGGKQVPFGNLLPAFKSEADEIELMIKEHERQIFEEILLNTISSRIKAKVVLSKEWIKNINNIMAARGNSQRLEIKLVWEPGKAQEENELSIKKVMEILEDDKAISSENITRLSKHFGSKIKNKIRESKDSGEHPNYQMILKEVLDYRKWFEFKLFVNKDNEGMKELTQKNFNQLSVGERAMAMYIPLFAAVNARYDNADKKCPRIVCMDEAFAGISENNKRILFALLRDMKLEYILNSQELWGTYEEVDSLNIYELFREPSDKFVNVSRSHWDGVRRVYVE